MISHDNMVWTIHSAFMSLTDPKTPFSDEERVVSYLPLSHIAGLINDVISHAYVGHKVYFARPDAL